MNKNSKDNISKGNFSESDTHPSDEGDASANGVTLPNENFIDRETFQRLKADFENYRRRTESERQTRDQQIVSDFMETLLPVIEAFEAGMEYSQEALKPVYDLFLSALSSGGLVALNPELGEPFDPNIHEAVASSESDEGNNELVVKKVLRSGYLWNEKLLRPAQVEVGG